MPQRMTQPLASDLVGSLDKLRPTPAKAGLRPTSESDAVGSPDPGGLIPVVIAAVVSHYGSVKCAAISLNNVDPSLMMREFQAGKFGRLEACDQEAKAAVARELYKAFGQSDPKSQARRLIQDARARLDQLAELIEQKVSA